ncbi:hypothetical protein O4157_15665 [Gordonia amicalis]|uniref:hypothetical protein n=1 Tax=Gordonia amicalis TaxID=89053 RepID=UPI0003FE9088|nr:hypothetical protein [Gordonia amicalis]MCZ0914194.1 hypothetical protein [Gordonia amicalis]MCZ4652860.1 hypothetical protein [Gordonia amicalis]
MPRFLAILNGSAGDIDRVGLTEQQQADFMTAWSAWAQAHQTALIDPGAPLFRKRRVTADGVEEFEDAKVAYAVVEADSHDDAVRILGEHPHLTLFRGNSIEVIECPAILD